VSFQERRISVGEDFISQDEIDALLNSGGFDEANSQDEGKLQSKFDQAEIDAIGELGNISMGTSATTLASILSKKVEITTPQVDLITLTQLRELYQEDCVAVKVEYVKGIHGVNHLLLGEKDVKIITDLMMGGDGTHLDDAILELHLSAIGEAMNQMVASSATSLSKIFGSEIDISPPKATLLKSDDNQWFLDQISEGDQFASVTFKMDVENLMDSQLVQILPFDLAKEMAQKMLAMSTKSNEKKEEQPKPTPKASSSPQSQNKVSNPSVSAPRQEYQEPTMSGAPQNPPTKAVPKAPKESSYHNVVNVQPANFQTFDEGKVYMEQKNVDLIMDVPLEIAVELGRTKRLIKDILELGAGSIIELDKLAEEPVDILVNGRVIAKGEVVVIDESFGVRITEILQNSIKI
jgi:flagellar motor switch protein FliN